MTQSDYNKTRARLNYALLVWKQEGIAIDHHNCTARRFFTRTA